MRGGADDPGDYRLRHYAVREKHDETKEVRGMVGVRVKDTASLGRLNGAGVMSPISSIP